MGRENGVFGGGDSIPASVAMPDSGEAKTALKLKGRKGTFEPSARSRFDAFAGVRNGVLQLGEIVGVAFYGSRFGG